MEFLLFLFWEGAAVSVATLLLVTFHVDTVAKKTICVRRRLLRYIHTCNDSIYTSGGGGAVAHKILIWYIEFLEGGIS